MIPPDIPSSFVTPEMARNIQLEAFATIASTAVLIWDILLHLYEDYQQIREQGFFKVSRIVYCFSRLTTLIYMILLCVIETAPIGNCAWVRYAAALYPLTIPITLLLFLIRVQVFLRERQFVLGFVFLSWVCLMGSAIVVAVRTQGININGTSFCIKKMIARDVSDAVSTLTRFFHDTLVFIVTSWWLYTQNLTDGISFWSGVRGGHLRPLARSLLNDGQAYYLATLILNVVVIVLPLLPKPFVTPCTLGGPLFVLISNMACHVYRNLVNAKYRGHCDFIHLEGGGVEAVAMNTRLGASRNRVSDGNLGV